MSSADKPDAKVVQLREAMKTPDKKLRAKPKDESVICACFMTGLDEGPWLPGRAPRKRPKPKCSDELRAIRNKAWKTRCQKLGPKGHR